MDDGRIRKAKNKYADEIQRYASDMEVSMYTHIPHPYPQGEAMTFIKQSIKKCLDGKFMNFVITFKGKFAGIISYIHINVA